MVVDWVDNAERTRVNLIQRTTPRNAIVHETGWQVHHIISGQATIVTGGRVERSTDAAGNRVATIVDPESRQVAVGDVRHRPHWHAPLVLGDRRDRHVSRNPIRPWDRGHPRLARPPRDQLGRGGLGHADASRELSRRAPQRSHRPSIPATGGPTYLARFHAGSEFDPHWHTYDGDRDRPGGQGRHHDRRHALHRDRGQLRLHPVERASRLARPGRR